VEAPAAPPSFEVSEAQKVGIVKYGEGKPLSIDAVWTRIFLTIAQNNLEPDFADKDALYIRTKWKHVNSHYRTSIVFQVHTDLKMVFMYSLAQHFSDGVWIDGYDDESSRAVSEILNYQLVERQK